MAGNTPRRSRLTCVTRLPKDQQPLLEALSVSPSCHDESWHFECPARLVPSNVVSQPVVSNARCHNSFTGLNNPTAARNTTQLQQTYSVHPGSPCSAHPQYQVGSCAQILAAQQQAAQRSSQWQASTARDVHSAWQQQHPSPFNVAAQESSRGLTLSKIAHQRRMRPVDSTTACPPPKRHCTALQPQSTQAHFSACLPSSQSFQTGSSPALHLPSITAAAPAHALRFSSTDLGLRQRGGCTADEMLVRQQSSSQQPSVAAGVRARARSVASLRVNHVPDVHAHCRLPQDAEAVAARRHRLQQHRLQHWPNFGAATRGVLLSQLLIFSFFLNYASAVPPSPRPVPAFHCTSLTVSLVQSGQW
jgi:hypothetical protein